MQIEEAIENIKLSKSTVLFGREQTIVNIEDLDIVLNELEKKDKAIEQLKSINKFQSKDIKEAVDYTFELNKELEKKEKIIDEMANTLKGIKSGSKYCNVLKTPPCKNDKTYPCNICIKEFFYKKVGENNG